jgi:hypothetical protein
MTDHHQSTPPPGPGPLYELRALQRELDGVCTISLSGEALQAVRKVGRSTHILVALDLSGLATKIEAAGWRQ